MGAVPHLLPVFEEHAAAVRAKDPTALMEAYFGSTAESQQKNVYTHLLWVTVQTQMAMRRAEQLSDGRVEDDARWKAAMLSFDEDCTDAINCR